VDEAIRRRFYLIPFTVTIPPEKRDKDLFDKLRLECAASCSGLLTVASLGSATGSTRLVPFATQRMRTSPPKMLSHSGSMSAVAAT
jgi:hypothetical protein